METLLRKKMFIYSITCNLWDTLLRHSASSPIMTAIPESWEHLLDETNELLSDDNSGVVDTRTLNTDARYSRFETYGKIPKVLVKKQIIVKLEILRYRVLEQKIHKMTPLHTPPPTANIFHFSKLTL